MVTKGSKKRPAQPQAGPSKKRKILGKETQNAGKQKTKAKGKEKAADREIIPIPVRVEDSDVELSDQDMEFFEEYGNAAAFLDRLDEKAIARSKKETERLRQLHKPERKQVKDSLPAVDSGSEEDDNEEWSSGVEVTEDEESVEDDLVSEEEDEDTFSSPPPVRRKEKKSAESDEEMPYEIAPRKRRSSWEPEEEKKKGIERLPTKLADGRVLKSSAKVFMPQEESEVESEESEDEEHPPPLPPPVEDVSTGARFGRPAVVDVVSAKSRKARVQGAKEQIAGICQEIIADPENSLGLLRRLHTFSLPEISTPTHPEPVPNDPVIRKLTFLSQLAVFKDIIPGYRIRALTDKEKSEKVSQMVQRTRDWEQGLVSVYQAYLRSLETEIKARSELAEVGISCMCTLLVDATHFNFRANLMSSIVARLSRKSWDETSELGLNSLVKVFRGDLTGEASLELVRLLNRMVKERRFNVHPRVLSCLSHLRLKTELAVRSSEHKADKPSTATGKAAARRAKGKATEQPHLSKKAKKALKEKKEIEKELHEAAAEVDKEERSVHQTETLKLLFVLYFRILKNPKPTPLLPAALHGIARFSHLVNVDFFRDLLQVLKELMARESEHEQDASAPTHNEQVQHQLLCVVTAFELLSGQGEALDIDLTDFVNRLYVMLPSLAVMPEVEAPLPSVSKTTDVANNTTSVSDMLFRALHLVFSRRTAGASPPWRSAAFAKRLLIMALHWPPATALRALDFVEGLVGRDPKLGALLSTDDRTVDGVYKPEVDDPQLCNPFGTSFWELHLLARNHWHGRVREAAMKVLTLSSQ